MGVVYTAEWAIFNLIFFFLGTGANVLGDVSHMTVLELEEWGVGLNIGISWEDALHSALMPITPQASMGSLADGEGRGHGCGHVCVCVATYFHC